MNKTYLITLALASLLLCGTISCSPSEAKGGGTTDKTVDKKTVLPETVDFKSEAQSKTISLNNAKSYQISSSQSWCVAVPQANTLKISVEKNDETEVREAFLTVKSGSEESKIKVRQIGTDPAILVDRDIFSISAAGGPLDFEITTNVAIEVKLPDWIKKPTEARAMRKEQHRYTVQGNKGDDKRSGQIEIVQTNAPAGATPLRKLIAISQDGLKSYTAGLTTAIPEDEKITIVSGTASSTENASSSIEKSFDGDYNTIYHSSWANGASDYYPITLTYNFAEANEVNYFVYYPRTEGYNGRFHQFDLEYSADGKTFNKVDSYTLEHKSQPTRIVFARPLHAKSFRFVVRHGYGDRQGFVSCAEMEFYKKSPKSVDYRNIFVDELCTKVRPELTDAQIQAISDPFFRNLAYYIKNGKYNTEFRVASYKPFQNPSIVASKNKTYTCSLLDNPTGIFVREGEDLIAFVGDTHGYNDLGIRIQNLDKPNGDGFNDPVQFGLSRGFNKIKMTKTGLVYVLYHVGEGQAPKMKPIDIHFATGSVNGYYDSQNPNLSGRWKELLSKANYKYFDVVGKYAHLTFETEAFRNYTPEGRELTKTYDSIVHNEWILHGYYKYNCKPQNRMYLHVMYHAFMYATNYHTAYVSSTQESILNPDKMRNPQSQGAAWGPSHELGHVNQVTPGLKWRGMTEVTVNIPSEYITTYVFGQPSRLQKEELGDYYKNNRYTKAFTNVIAAGVPFCDAGDVFCQLVPFWQLELYFGKVLGRTPRKSADGISGFYPDMYQYMRTHADQPNPGTQQTEFPFVASSVSKRDLTRFFERWGFFSPVDKLIDDYAKEQMTVTEARSKAVKDRIKSLNLPAVDDLALEYITDSNAHLYKDRPSIVRGSKAVISGSTITIRGWQNAVAYEVYDDAGKLIFIADATYPSADEAKFTMNQSWKSNYTIKAVSAGNKREAVAH